MYSCDEVTARLALFMDHALPQSDQAGVEAHFASCEGCRSGLEEFLKVISVVREATRRDIAVPDAIRRRIAREAAAAATRRGSFGLPAWGLSFRPGLLAASAAIVLALLVLPAVLRQQGQPGGGAHVSRIDVTASDNGAVRLAWSDGSRSSYTVYKSHDPRTFRDAQTHVIRGNSWVDRDSDGSPIVFYRIE